MQFNNVFFSLQAQRSPNSRGQQPKTQGPPQTRARTGAPPTDAGSEHSGKRQHSNGNNQPQPKRLTLPHTDGHTLHDCRWRRSVLGSSQFILECFFRSKRNAVQIPKACNRKRKPSHRREREQAPHQQTPGANTVAFRALKSVLGSSKTLFGTP